MKNLLSFWFIFCFLLIRLAYPQADSISELIEKDVLNADDLVLFADSSRIRIITAGRISTNLEDLPFTVYVITHEDIPVRYPAVQPCRYYLLVTRAEVGKKFCRHYSLVPQGCLWHNPS